MRFLNVRSYCNGGIENMTLEEFYQEYCERTATISRDDEIILARMAYERYNAMSKEQLIEIVMGKEWYLTSKM